MRLRSIACYCLRWKLNQMEQSNEKQNTVVCYGSFGPVENLKYRPVNPILRDFELKCYRSINRVGFEKWPLSIVVSSNFPNKLYRNTNCKLCWSDLTMSEMYPLMLADRTCFGLSYLLVLSDLTLLSRISLCNISLTRMYLRKVRKFQSKESS